MGFWSGDKDVYVSSVLYPLGEEVDKIPDIIKANVIAAGMQGSSRSKAIIKAIFDGQGIKLRQAYNYAANSYYRPLPLGMQHVSNDDDDRLIDVLLTEYLAEVYGATPVTVLTSFVDHTTNYDTIVRQQIETKYNYDFFAETVHTTVFGLPVGSRLSFAPLQDDPVNHANEEGWRLTFTKPDSSVVTFDEWYVNTLFSAEDQKTQLRLIYSMSIDGAPSVTRSYADGGSDARLNLFLRNNEQNRSGTFPAITIKKKGDYINLNPFHTNSSQPPGYAKTTAAYKTSKRYARQLGVDMDQLIQTLEDNPDSNKIDYAFIQPGTIISSPNQCAKEYLFRYFDRLRLSFPDNKAKFDSWWEEVDDREVSEKKAKKDPHQSVRIKDPEDDDRSFNVEIVWRYITYEEKTGTLTDPYETEVGPPDARSVRVKEKLFNIVYDFTKFYLRKRLTENTYAELTVCGLMHVNYVFKKETVVSKIYESYRDVDNDYGTGFLIPLEHEVYMSMSPRAQLQLAQESVWLVLNCYKVVKEKWYQTGIFKVVMLIISMVVIYFSAGSLTGPVLGLYESVSAVVGAVLLGASLTVIAAVAAVITALIMAAIMIGIQYLAQEAGEWAAERWGPVWGAVVQIAATVALSYGVGQLSGFQITPTNLVDSVMLGASWVMAGFSTYTQFAMAELQEEVSDWEDYVNSPDNPQKQLEQLWDETFPELSLPAQMWFAPRESLDEFLGRTLGLTDTLSYRLTAPIQYMTEMTLTPRLL